MRVVVFGGTGNVGRIIVQKLLEQGNEVIVLTRQTKDGERNLQYVIGNVLDPETVERCIEPGDTIVIALGFNNSSLDTMSRGTAIIIAAMKKNSAKRVICLSAQGASESWNYMPEEFKEMVLNDELLNASFKDHGKQEELVRQSGLEWTIVRPTEIVDQPSTATFTVNHPTPSSKFHISTFDVAQFIVDELKQSNFVRDVAMITD